MVIFFFFLFAVGIFGAGLIVTKKIPLVLATPRQMIEDYFRESSSRMHIRVLRLKTWVKMGGYWDQLSPVLMKSLRWLHGLFLKLENRSLDLMDSVRQKSETSKMRRAQEANPEYWDEIRSESAKVNKGITERENQGEENSR